MLHFIKRNILFILILITSTAKSQDIIIKNDKMEIKAKVSEITEDLIKYRKWDNLDGPIYNISKSEIFMILYANGQREIIQRDTTISHPLYPNSSGNSLNDQLQKDNNHAVDTTVDYKHTRIRYAPFRLLYWFDTPPTTLGFDKELRIVKNVLNFGFGTHYSFVSDYSQVTYTFYIAPYLPINRLFGTYEKQNKGLFINAMLGYGAQEVRVDGVNYDSGGFLIGFGADFLITNGFGLTLTGFKYGESEFSLQGGLSLQF